MRMALTAADHLFCSAAPGGYHPRRYSPEDRIELAANDKYFVPGEPKLARLTIIFFKDENASVDALRGGQVDLVPRLLAGNFTALQSETGITTVNVPTNGLSLVRLRADHKPGSDPRVMQAITMVTVLGFALANLAADLGKRLSQKRVSATFHVADTLF